jgi:hypothetical protein
VVGLLSYTPLVHAADKLSGEWNLTLTPDAGGKPFDDLLRFKAGVVGSEFFAKKGFTPAPYETVEPRFGPIKFSSTSKSDAGLLSLQGTVLADSIEGTVAWTDPAGTTTTNWSFKGTRKE